MAYALGVDLGTATTAAAVAEGGVARMITLGSGSFQIPTVVAASDDGALVVGEVADRRGLAQPDRVAREFKRRVGDPVPIVIGGAARSPEELMARVLEEVVDLVARREGGRPDRVTLTHPANWGEARRRQLLAIAERAGVVAGAEVALLTEPEAVAVHYASLTRVEPGALVAVYDLGGGTFDAAVLRKTADGFEILGEPQGIERLGGIDFDQAVVEHVLAALGPRWAALDLADPVVRAAAARLRRDCTEAKEALSGDTAATVPVHVGDLRTEVTVTRAEFEARVRPALEDTVATLRAALDSAGVEVADLQAVLLAGGSSRIPLVAELVGAELGVPVAVDVDPKGAVALGAALHAGGGAGRVAPVPPHGGAAATASSRPGPGRRALVAALAALVLVVVAVAALAWPDGDEDGGEVAADGDGSGGDGGDGEDGGTGQGGDDGAAAVEVPVAEDPLAPSTMLFTSIRDDLWEIWALDTEDGEVRPVTRNVTGRTALPALSPDRRSALYTKEVGEGVPARQLWVMRVDGSGQAMILDGLAGDARAAWAPDGRRVAVVVEQGGREDLAVLHLDDGRLERVTDSVEREGDPAWSPDGELAFWVASPDGSDLWVLDADLDAARQLTAGEGEDADPAWSPDGSTVAFSRRVGAGSWALHTVAADGGEPAPLTTPPAGANDQDPTWSPDGERLAFESRDRPESAGRHLDLWVVGADGTDPRPLTENPNLDAHPAWR